MSMEIVNGYCPGLIGTVTRHFSQHFHEHCGFGPAFEARVAREMADFVDRLPSDNLAIWHALDDGEIMGSITIDGDNLGGGKAHLRWFILDPRAQGQGLGGQFMRYAMEFCDARGFEETHLWTVKGTDAARALYERHGFELAEEYLGDQWGSPTTEQRFVRPQK